MKKIILPLLFLFLVSTSCSTSDDEESSLNVSINGKWNVTSIVQGDYDLTSDCSTPDMFEFLSAGNVIWSLRSHNCEESMIEGKFTSNNGLLLIYDAIKKDEPMDNLEFVYSIDPVAETMVLFMENKNLRFYLKRAN